MRPNSPSIPGPPRSAHRGPRLPSFKGSRIEIRAPQFSSLGVRVGYGPAGDMRRTPGFSPFRCGSSKVR